MMTGNVQAEGLATEPAVILVGRVNAVRQRKIIVGEAERLRLMTCHDIITDGLMRAGRKSYSSR
ncbi:MAG: hypothetical protein BGO69_10760 [Bacteroidetes bacterium 46-16]|nr:MAG: hypothetical protein BGO69_10760 [Bacteroidetes bacterium 46-16]